MTFTHDGIEESFDCEFGSGIISRKPRSLFAPNEPTECRIHWLVAKGAGRGNGRATVLALRKHFGVIIVVRPDAIDFWRQMLREGLVDGMLDWDGSRVA
jgi:hypothetical protein